jgi:hypothetical protein
MKTTLALIALCIAATCHAQNQPRQILFSQGDPALHLTESDETGAKGYSAVWKGRLVLTGKLVVEFDRAPESTEQTDTEGAAYFEPDERSRGRLPVATSFYPAPATVLWLPSTPRRLLEPLIGKKAFRNVAAGTSARYEYPAEVHIKSYSTSIDCDHRSYSIEIVRIKLLPTQRYALAEARNLGC